MSWLQLDWQPVWLTLQLAAITTVILLVLGVPLAYRIAYSRSRFKPVWESLVSMPLVLPPSVLGFYLLLMFSPRYAFGQWLEQVLHIKIVFSFSGLVIGSVLFSLPFMVQPVQAAFQNLPRSLLEASRTLGKSDTESFFRVLLPSVRPALLSGTVLAFAHTIGEFGVVLMIGGNIPGQTRLASMAIYNEVESLNYAAAHAYAAVLFVISFAILLTVYIVQRRSTVGGVLR